MATTTSTVISLNKLSEHKDRKSMWVAVHGHVYDLTTFAEDHPGGIEVLKDSAGTDATEAFDYVGHDQEAVDTMQKFLVGNLEGHTNGSASAKTPVTLLKKPAQALNKAKAAAGGHGAPSSTPVIAAALLAAVGLVVLVASLFWKSESMFTRLMSDSSLGQNSTFAFLGGLGLAASGSFAGLTYLYVLFSKTLEHEKSVFAYPPIIPKKSQQKLL